MTSTDDTAVMYVPFRPNELIAKLRVVADSLENGSMSYLSGELTIQSHLTGELSINSDIMLSCRTQLEVVKAIAAENVYLVLYKLGVNDSETLSFDLDERDDAHEWSEIASDVSNYPLLMRNCRFRVMSSPSNTGSTIKVTRRK